MPHITIKTYPIPEEQKLKLASEIEKLIVEVTGKSNDFISIAIRDVKEDVWMKEVYEAEIFPNPDTLYKKPGY